MIVIEKRSGSYLKEKIMYRRFAMKRIVSVAVCVVLLFGLLTLVSEPAQMDTSTITVSVNTTSAKVGDTLRWDVSVEGISNPSYSISIDRDGKEFDYDDGFVSQNYKEVVASIPGTYTAFVIVRYSYWSSYAPYYRVILYFPQNPPAVVVTGPKNQIVNIEATGATSLKLTWNRLSWVSGYELWRSASKTGTYKLVKSTTATTYTNTYLTAGTRYFYKVRTYTMEGGVKEYGSFSAALSGVPLAKSAISSAVGTSTSQIKLTWKTVSGASGYQILRSTTAGGEYSVIKTTAALTYTAGGMQHAKTYYFKVRPYKQIGTVKYFGPLSGYKAGKTK